MCTTFGRHGWFIWNSQVLKLKEVKNLSNTITTVALCLACCSFREMKIANRFRGLKAQT